MAFISKMKYAEISPATLELWDKQVKDHGRMTNMKMTLAHSDISLKIYMDWYPLKEAVSKFLGERSTIIFVYALSAETDCLICSTYFRKTLLEWKEDPDAPELDETEKLLVDFAKHFTKNANHIPSKTLAGLKKFFNEKQIVEITALAGLMVATNLFNNALKIDLDDYLADFKKGGE